MNTKALPLLAALIFAISVVTKGAHIRGSHDVQEELKGKFPKLESGISEEDLACGDDCFRFKGDLQIPHNHQSVDGLRV